MEDGFGDRLARACFEKFHQLPEKSGKPGHAEWTSLAGVVVSFGNDNAGGNLVETSATMLPEPPQENEGLRVVSLATGSKCVGWLKMAPDVLSDSHAEILARRAFLRFLYHQLTLSKKGKSEIFYHRKEDNKFVVKRNVRFHFYTSHVPCGDAAIVPKVSDIRSEVNEDSAVVRDENANNPPVKKCRVEDEDAEVTTSKDIHRTGAKCLPHGPQDAKQRGALYHVLGAVRTKPGRGHPTLSVSCSDKIFRWNCVGIQGALLSTLIEKPIFLASVAVGGEIYSETALKRSLTPLHRGRRRNVTPDNNRHWPPILFFQAKRHSFPHAKSLEKSKASPCAIVWCDVPGKNHEVCADGRPLGSTRKRPTESFLSKRNLFKEFRSLTNPANDHLTYAAAKSGAVSYYSRWKTAKEEAQVVWVSKPTDINEFKW